MSPETHLLASWLIAAKTTDNPRDRRLVTLAGIVPDADGLGLIIDVIGKAFGYHTALYQQWHHWLLHGAFGALLVSLLFAGLARQRLRVGLLTLAVFHLHLLCDLLGSRGPTVSDFWPIYYLGPFSRQPVWIWQHQWRLDGWQNRIFTLALFGSAIWQGAERGDSVVGVFNQRADAVFVSVLRKWQAALLPHWQEVRVYVKRPPWRTVVPGLMVFIVMFGSYGVWQPGLDVRDGDHDRRRNGIWLSHGWLGDDEWFAHNGPTNQVMRFRDSARIRELATLLRSNHITDVFPHLCPTDKRGNLALMNDEQAERFLSEFTGFRVMPWIGGVNGSHVHYTDPNWCATFTLNINQLLSSHPRFAGVHLNVEPVRSGDEDFLRFLRDLHLAMPQGKLLSVAAYPPPTRWHPYPELHWEQNFFQQVSSNCDQVVVMMYDTGLRVPKLYQQLTADWTAEVLDWTAGKPVLLGVPTYADSDSGYHHPRAENLASALLGIHSALQEQGVPRNYQGISIYCEWETDDAEWNYLREHFLKH